MLKTHYVSTRGLTRALSDLLAERGHTLSPLLYNRFDVDGSTWWLSPKRIRPAYRLAKIQVSHFRKGSPDFLVGMVIERGLNHNVLGASYQMTQAWDWRRILPRIVAEGGELHRILEDCGAPAEVYVGMGWGREWDQVYIPVRPDGLGEPVRTVVGKARLDTLLGATSLSSLATTIAALPPGVWIDVIIGARVSQADLGPGQRIPELAALSDRLVAPLADWLWGAP